MLINNVRELGLRIRDQRRDLGWSQEALASRIGVSRYWVMQIERGSVGAEVGHVFDALKALGLVVDIRPRNAPSTNSTNSGLAVDLAAILDRARGKTP